MWLEAVEFSSGLRCTALWLLKVTNGPRNLQLSSQFLSFFEEFLSSLTFPNGLESVKFEGFIFALLLFLGYNSIHSIAMPNNIKIKLTYIARNTSSSQIATTAILLFFSPHERHIRNNFDDVRPIPIKVHPPP